MSGFTRYNTAILKRCAGTDTPNCSATLNGQPMQFYGIFKTQTLIKDDESSAAIWVDQDTLFVDSISIGNLIKENTAITVNGIGYVAAHKKQKGDGSMTEIVLQQV